MQGDWDALCVKHDGDWKFAELTVTHWYRATAPWVGEKRQVRLERDIPWG